MSLHAHLNHLTRRAISTSVTGASRAASNDNASREFDAVNLELSNASFEVGAWDSALVWAPCLQRVNDNASRKDVAERRLAASRCSDAVGRAMAACVIEQMFSRIQ